MEIFLLTLKQMLVMFFLIAVGFLLRKKRLLPENAGIVMAKLETYAFVPALFFYSQLTKCTVQTFRENYVLLLYGLAVIVVCILIAYPLSRLFVRKKDETAELAYQRNVYRYALALGNYGFVGNFLVLGVWGNDLFYKYSLFTFFVAILCNSWGLYNLIPKDQNSGVLSNLKKGLLAPPVVALVLGIVSGLLGLKKYLPDFVLTALDNAGKCQGPVAMLLAGFVIGGYDLKELLLNKKIYAVSLMRLVVLPAAIMLIMMLLGVSKEIMTLALIAFAVPIGLNTIVFPAAYGGETKTGASMTVISQILSVATVPLMYLVFIELL